MATTSFKFDKRTTKVLEELKDHYGATSKAEVLRKAIGLLDIAADAENQNRHLVVESEDQTVKQRILVR